MEDVRPVPRITIQAFCETDIVAQTIDMTGKDRRMSRTQVKVLMGGIPSAVDYYGSAPTPNLIIIESKLAGPDLLAGLSRLAEVCDIDTKVIVIGHQNDIAIYRELISNGISDYLVAPLSMADLMGAISDIFVDPETGPLGRIDCIHWRKGRRWFIDHLPQCGLDDFKCQYKNDVVLADLDLAFGTANINLDQDPPQGIAEAVYSPDRIDDILLDRLSGKMCRAPQLAGRAFNAGSDL